MRTAVLLTCLAALVGCGGGNDDKDQIRELMMHLREAQESGDAERACEHVYVVREKEGESEEGGRECREAFERAVEARRRDVRDLETELVRVDVEGDEGTAVLHTKIVRQDGSTLERDVPYDVVRTEEGWRIRIAGEG